MLFIIRFRSKASFEFETLQHWLVNSGVAEKLQAGAPAKVMFCHIGRTSLLLEYIYAKENRIFATGHREGALDGWHPFWPKPRGAPSKRSRKQGDKKKRRTDGGDGDDGGDRDDDDRHDLLAVEDEPLDDASSEAASESSVNSDDVLLIDLVMAELRRTIDAEADKVDDAGGESDALSVASAALRSEVDELFDPLHSEAESDGPAPPTPALSDGIPSGASDAGDLPGDDLPPAGDPGGASDGGSADGGAGGGSGGGDVGGGSGGGDAAVVPPGRDDGDGGHDGGDGDGEGDGKGKGGGKGKGAATCFVRLPNGIISFYASSGHFVAECKLGHSITGLCHCQRTRSNKANPRKPAQGRPLGYLAAWLASYEPGLAGDKDDHCAFQPSFELRIEQRILLDAYDPERYRILGGYERPRGFGEGSEPERLP